MSFFVSLPAALLVPYPLPAVTIPAQSSRIKARATEAAQCKQVPDASSNKLKQIETGVASSDVEASPVSAIKAAGGLAKKSDPDTDVPASTAEIDLNGVTATRSKIHKGGCEEVLPPGPTKEGSAEGTGGKTSHLTAVAVCVAGAVMSSMLQFSFVYGEICFHRSSKASARHCVLSYMGGGGLRGAIHTMRLAVRHSFTGNGESRHTVPSPVLICS